MHTLASCEAFKNEDIDTGFIEKNHDQIFNAKTSTSNTPNANKQSITNQLPMAALALVLQQANNANNLAVTKYGR